MNSKMIWWRNAYAAWKFCSKANENFENFLVNSKKFVLQTLRIYHCRSSALLSLRLRIQQFMLSDEVQSTFVQLHSFFSNHVAIGKAFIFQLARVILSTNRWLVTYSDTTIRFTFVPCDAVKLGLLLMQHL